MAVAFQSVSTKAFANGTSTVIDKPTGLAVGDCLIAHVVAFTSVAQESNVFNTPTGWTSVNSASITDAGANTVVKEFCFSRIATSADVAATNFTFTWSGSSTSLGGALYRISGSNPTPVTVSASASVEDQASPFSASASVTPTEADSLLLFLVAGNGATAFNSYSIATSNPSWTEDYDYTDGGSNSIAGAHASRPQITATGNASVSYSGPGDITVMIIVVRPTVSTTVTQVAGALTLTGGTQAIKVGVRIVQVAAALMLTGGTQLIKRVSQWTNLSKNSSSWTNQNKSN